MGPNATSTGRDLQVVRDAPDQGGPAQALTLLENANRVAEETVAQAKDEAERVLTAARSEADQVRREAREQGLREREAADRDADRARHEKLGEAERLLDQARNEVGELERTATRLRSEREAAAHSARELGERLMAAVNEGNPGDGHQG